MSSGSSSGASTGEELAQNPEAEKVLQYLERGAEDELRAYLEPFHPSDLADLIESLEEDQRPRVLGVLPDEVASDTLAEMEEIGHPEDLLIADPSRVAELVQELSDDDAADLLAELPEEKLREVLAQLPLTEAGEIRQLMAYDEESAGGVMTTEVISVRERATVSEAIDEIRRQVSEGEDFYTVFVVDEVGRLQGTVSFQNLIISPPSKPISELTEPSVAVVPATMDQEEVARIMSRYNLVSVPVVDPLNRLIGRVTFDDIMDIVEAETTEDILRLSGTSAEEYLRGGVIDAIRHRLPWLFVNLLTAFVAAGVVYLFQRTIERAVILAVFMPIIAGMGGNAGTQALAVTVRRLALSQERSEASRAVLKEVGVGLANGAAIGLAIALIGLVLPGGGAALGLVVMLAMWLNLAVAGSAGAFVPVVLERLGIDPAVASSVFVTTFTDLCGFFFLLGLATRFLLPNL
jgi:magnesium transporter